MDRILNTIPSPPDVRDAGYHVSTLSLEPALPPLPITVTPLPMVWDQGSTGTCVGHGALLAIAVAFYQKLGYWIVNEPAFAEQSARDLYLQATGDTTYSQGADIRTALKCAAATGVLGKDKTGKVQRFKLASYHTILPSSNVEVAFETAIAAGLVVVAGVDWPTNWMVPSAVVLPRALPVSAGGHCVGFWRAVGARGDILDCLRNSWGAKWGNGFGNAYVSQGDFLKQIFDLWVVQV